MSEVQTTTPVPETPKWPAAGSVVTPPPLTHATLANAAARAAVSNSRRDLIEYLRLRRKPA